jgi:hypothetical protein
MLLRGTFFGSGDVDGVMSMAEVSLLSGDENVAALTVDSLTSNPLVRRRAGARPYLLVLLMIALLLTIWFGLALP